MECLEQLIDMLTELVNTLVAALGQNVANVTPVIPSRIPPANTEGEEALPPQEGEGARASETRIDTNARQRRPRCRRRNTRQGRPEN